ncbi:MAG: hypothetical protein N2578_04360 [Bdellovibrionaceae bacterium]|nr:hypothetical protein [Pseudobdellovibrionaceae bacterium]
MSRALSRLQDGREFYCGDGGTTLRFLALRCSRNKGRYILRGSERLMSRPQQVLLSILAQLGVEAGIENHAIAINSSGWQKPRGAVVVSVSESSQFVSAVLLNCWGLDFDLEIRLEGKLRSESYLQMTLDMLRQRGMRVEESAEGFFVPAGQTPSPGEMRIEPDLSSAFALAAIAACCGEFRLLDFPQQSVQGDAVFVDLLGQMGAFVEKGSDLLIKKAERLCGLSVDLSSCPDLFPVLAVLCSQAEGRSVLRGAPQLRFKESNRIKSVSSLLEELGVKHQCHSDGVEIESRGWTPLTTLRVRADHDHRGAMAARLLAMLGHEGYLDDPGVVEKSFPEFWDLTGLRTKILIGHRGVGKSALAERLSTYGVKPVVDLDQVISDREGRPVTELFENFGEAKFREIELSALRNFVDSAPLGTVISVGAGLLLDRAPRGVEHFWVQRDTDSIGRIFLNRPRLERALSPSAEYTVRFRQREPLYSRYSHSGLLLPEGLRRPDELERKIIFNLIDGAGGAVTLFPEKSLRVFSVGAEFYEYRDDLFQEADFERVRSFVPRGRLLYSHRCESPHYRRHLDSVDHFDWALESGLLDRDVAERFGENLIVSSHAESVEEGLLDLKIFMKKNLRLKLCPKVHSFLDLKTGHEWWLQDPERRVFLPRSDDGRWAWYRLWGKGRFFLNFWRNGRGSSLDQPSLYWWMSAPGVCKRFAAVLGDPVDHSWTPMEQREFFSALGMPVFSIKVNDVEFAFALEFLRSLGLVAAAVTSPLKKLAFRTCSHVDDRASEFRSVNTMVLQEGRWCGTNTDLAGLEKALLVAGISSPVVIWGGGGTLPLLQKLLPDAVEYSARTARPREGHQAVSPRTVIWAAPRGESNQWPPAEWRPDLVFDLNYREDSPGREYAQRCGARYFSGETMFYAQAEGQRQFWKDKL